MLSLVFRCPRLTTFPVFDTDRTLQCLDASPLSRKLRLSVLLNAQFLTLFVDDLGGRIIDELLVAELGLDPDNLMRYLGQFFVQAL